MNTNKKFILASLIATGLMGCNAEDDTPEGLTSDKQGPSVIYSPTIAQMPSPIDLFFVGTTDLTLNLPSTSAPAQAANGIDGWSTVAPITIKFNQELDAASIIAGKNIRIFRTCINPFTTAPSFSVTGDSLGELEAGVDYVANLASVDDPATGQTGDQVIKVRFLKALAPKFDATSLQQCPEGTRPEGIPASATKAAGYLVVLDNTRGALKSKDGEVVTGSDFYNVAKGRKCLFRAPDETTETCGLSDERDNGGPGLTPAGEDAGLATASPASQAKTETLRRLTNGHEDLSLLYASKTADPLPNNQNIIMSWQFTPQSIGSVMDVVDQIATGTANNPGVPGTTLFNAGIDTSALTNQPADGQIFVGTVNLPHYLVPPSSSDTNSFLNAFWESEPNAALGNSTNLTFANPKPKQRSTQEVPVFAVVPKAGIANGAQLPIAIVQHGIGSNRVNIVAVAEALAKAGVATIAIDLPLHGITDSSNPLQQAGKERTGGVLTSGVQASQAFLNLSSLRTGRDNIRQAVADLLYLEEYLPKISFVSPNGDSSVSFGVDQNKLTYVGHSLGGIVGTSYLAYSDRVNAATLAMPGGGIGKLLDASGAFGSTIAAQLQAAGVNEGEKGYEDFLMLAQLAVDSGDPLNTAKLIDANLPIHFIEVVGNLLTGGRNPPDVVVPNDAARAFPMVDDMVPEPGLGGSSPLIDALGLTRVQQNAGPQTLGPPVRHAVLFDKGHHSSILIPSDAATGVDEPAITGEMLNEVAQFHALGGSCLPVNSSCFPAP